MAEEKNESKEEKRIEKPKTQQQQAGKRVTLSVEGLPISIKHSIAICKFIRNKTVAEAVQMLQGVLDFKKAVPMSGELPHRKGMCAGRYPINASRQIIRLLKNLNANASNIGIDSSNLIIHAKADISSRRRSSRRARYFKRTNLFIELKGK